MANRALAEKLHLPSTTARALAGRLIEGLGRVLNAANAGLGRSRTCVAGFSVVLLKLSVGKVVASLPLALLAAQPLGRHDWVLISVDSLIKVGC